MKKIGKISVLIFFCFGFMSNAQSQNEFIQIEVSNSTPSTLEQIKISYVLKKKIENGMASFSHNGMHISKPNFPKQIEVLQEGSEQSEWGFGSMNSQDMELSKYSFIVRATQKGTFTIPPFKFTFNNKTITSKSLNLSVGKASQFSLPKENSDLFIRLEVAKNRLYKGEQTQIAYVLYSRYQGLSSEELDIPINKGIWREEIKAPKSGWPQKRVSINGKGYLKITLRKDIIASQKVGKLKLEPTTMKIRVGQSFFNNGRLQHLKSNTPTLTIKALPPAPKSFSGQVGTNYKMNVSYSKSTIKQGDPLDIKINISGKGNLKELSDFKLNISDDFQLYEPEKSENITVSSSGVKGRIKLNYLAIPQHHGTYNFPPLELTYFDVAKKRYITLSKPAHTLIVVQNKTKSQVQNFKTSTKKDIVVLDKTIRHIQTKKTVYFWENISNAMWYFIYLILIGVILVMRFFGGVKLTMPTTKSSIKKEIKQLQILLDKQDPLFYQKIDELIKTKRDSVLKSKKIDTLNQLDEQLSKDIDEVLNTCELARFTPLKQQNANDLFHQTNHILQQLNRYV